MFDALHTQKKTFLSSPFKKETMSVDSRAIQADCLRPFPPHLQKRKSDRLKKRALLIMKPQRNLMIRARLGVITGCRQVVVKMSGTN